MRIVVKIGTSTLTHATGRLNIRRVECLCKTLSDLKNAGNEIILVSSGAIGMGVGKLMRLLELQAIPIVNENDAVVTDEIGVDNTIGENDTLSAIVAQLTEADLLVLLSDIEGLYTADPRRDPEARLIERVEAITPEIEALAGGEGSSLGTGGMATKLSAAKIALEAGTDMVIANGQTPEILYEIAGGKAVGTRFIAKERRV